jgi:hypothetical protein
MFQVLVRPYEETVITLSTSNNHVGFGIHIVRPEIDCAVSGNHNPRIVGYGYRGYALPCGWNTEDNVIFYEHRNTICFNWNEYSRGKRWTEKDVERFKRECDRLIGTYSINVELKTNE